MFPDEAPLARLVGTFPRPGLVTWIGVRPARRAAMQAVIAAEAIAGAGLTGDHFAGGSGKRGITLMQAEHLVAVARLAGIATIEPNVLRRNIVIAGLNLLALKDRRFRIGTAVLEATGACHPCSRMEEALGPGGYNAMRGHGGLTARVITSGRIATGDAVVPLAGHA